MKTSLKNWLRVLQNHFAIIPSHPVAWKKGISVGAEERGRTRVQTEMIEFIALPFPSSKTKTKKNNNKIWSFHVVVVQGRQTNVQKKRDARAELFFC